MRRKPSIVDDLKDCPNIGPKGVEPEIKMKHKSRKTFFDGRRVWTVSVCKYLVRKTGG
jgi:hypothetical protein